MGPQRGKGVGKTWPNQGAEAVAEPLGAHRYSEKVLLKVIELKKPVLESVFNQPQCGHRKVSSMPVLRITGFEHRRQQVISHRRFLERMLIAIALWFVIAVVGLAIGIAGYAGFEGMSLVDAYLNAAMILAGMGPVSELKTTGGKVFAGTYAIFSGLVIIIATGVVLAPIFHRVLHRFHVETSAKAED
jgi:hypothetical protein